jgi:hypothetical protein
VKLKTETKRHAGVEPSSTRAAKQPKAARAPSPVRASTQKTAVPSSPAHGSDDDCVQYCSMLGVLSTTSSSSSSTGSSASESSQASPPNLDVVVSSAVVVTGSVLPSIPEMLELDAAQATTEPDRTPRNAGGFAGMYLGRTNACFWL